MLRFIITIFVVTSSFASVSDTIETNVKSNNNTKISQTKIDRLSQQHQELFMEYRAQLRELEILKTYNKQLEQVIKAQKDEMKNIDQQIVEIEITQQRIMPLMSKMISTLNEFVEQDIPFLEKLREKKREKLNELLAKSNLTVSQKYRYIVEAYEIELDYGRTIETYEGKLESGESVHFLRIGRTGLYYLSHNEQRAGMYNTSKNTFEELDSKYIKQIKTGIKIARKQSAPQLLKLPVVATKG